MMFTSLRPSISKPQWVPLLINVRWKVRILGKDTIGEPGTSFDMYYPEKPKVKTKFIDVLGLLHRKDLGWELFQNWRKMKRLELMREDQRFMPDRHRALGPDLATAHFLALRGGKIKFAGSDKWISKDDVLQKNVPDRFIAEFKVEEIDASGVELLYEGFDNLCNLVKLKKLHLRNCFTIDDWCLSRNYLFANSLELLDISGCHSVTERGICTLHSLKSLKTLIINDTPNIQNKELVILLLQDLLPKCEVIGVNYNDPVLLKRIENFIP